MTSRTAIDRSAPDGTERPAAVADGANGDVASAQHPADAPARGPRAGASLYVHVPFCESKCSYCDFYSVPHDGSGRARYLDALEREGRTRRPDGFLPPTVFVGGGTPTALDDRDFERMLGIVRELAAPDPSIEWTVECNPGSLTPWKAARMREAGVTRLSIGVQSFDDRILRSVGRVHDGRTARDAIAIARGAGIPFVSLDLLFAIPGQGMETFERDLSIAIELGTDHVSAYALLYEEGTLLERRRAAGRVEPEEEDVELAMLRLARARLGDAGFERYEISNFARPGARCRHNLGYWRNDPYLGIGASAASYLDGERRTNVASWQAYQERVLAGTDPVASAERLDARRAAGEEAMLRLRTVDGFSLRETEERWGAPAIVAWRDTIRRLERSGLVHVSTDGDRVALTDAGFEVADPVMASFIVTE